MWPTSDDFSAYYLGSFMQWLKRPVYIVVWRFMFSNSNVRDISENKISIINIGISWGGAILNGIQIRYEFRTDKQEMSMTSDPLLIISQFLSVLFRKRWSVLVLVSGNAQNVVRRLLVVHMSTAQQQLLRFEAQYVVYEKQWNKHYYSS